MKESTIFITYNPKSDLEQTLAVRLHTIGAVNGFRMFLPDRYNSNTILDNETKNRIAQADYFILFSTSKISKIVEAEIDYAYQTLKNNGRILVVFDDKSDLKSINKKSSHYTAIPFDPDKDSQEEVVKKVMNILEKEVQKPAVSTPKLYDYEIIRPQKSNNNALKAFLLTALGLYALSALTNEE